MTEARRLDAMPAQRSIDMTTNIILVVLAAVFLVLYMMRRRSRLKSED